MGGDLHVILSREICLLWHSSLADGTTMNSMGSQNQTPGRKVNFRARYDLFIDAQVNAPSKNGARSDSEMVTKMIWQR